VADWTWDPEKAAANKRKHRVSFELATRVFGDPAHLTRPDDTTDEARWRALGRPSAGSLVVLFVVHTGPDDDDTGRIISARQATRRERRDYEQGQF
jgi:uncharacterized DUF497 family protein